MRLWERGFMAGREPEGRLWGCGKEGLWLGESPGIARGALEG